MIEISLWSAKEKGLQSFGGSFTIREVLTHVGNVELRLEPNKEYRDSGRFEKRKWRRARIKIDSEDMAPLVAALAAQLKQMHDQLQSVVENVSGNRHATIDMYDIRDGNADLNWEKIQAILERGKQPPRFGIAGLGRKPK
jgi:hypothetical protein